MAIPENWKLISTNLPFSRLKAFLDALEQEKVQYVHGSISLFVQSAGCEFNFEGATYGVNEFSEEITSVNLLSANPAFTQTLINELEADLSVVVKERKYDEAKAINAKIEDLKNLLLI